MNKHVQYILLQVSTDAHMNKRTMQQNVLLMYDCSMCVHVHLYAVQLCVCVSRHMLYIHHGKVV